MKQPARLADDLLSSEELAVYVGVSLATVRFWRRAQSGPPAVLFGRMVKFRQGDVDDWLSEGRPRGCPDRRLTSLAAAYIPAN